MPKLPHPIEKLFSNWQQRSLDHCSLCLLAFPLSHLIRTNDLTIQAENTSPNFLSLPAELHNQITGEMDFPSALNLSKTNHQFRRTVDATNKPVPYRFCRELKSVSAQTESKWPASIQWFFYVEQYDCRAVL